MFRCSASPGAPPAVQSQARSETAEPGPVQTGPCWRRQTAETISGQSHQRLPESAVQRSARWVYLWVYSDTFFFNVLFAHPFIPAIQMCWICCCAKLLSSFFCGLWCRDLACVGDERILWLINWLCCSQSECWLRTNFLKDGLFVLISVNHKIHFKALRNLSFVHVFHLFMPEANFYTNYQMANHLNQHSYSTSKDHFTQITEK